MDIAVLSRITDRFCIEGNVTGIAETGSGHINDTYLVCTDRKKYILQRINTDVFRDPDALMSNVVAVTEHIGGRLRYIPVVGEDRHSAEEKYDWPGTAENGGWYVMADGGCWRMMTYIENSYSCEVTDDPVLLHEIGRAYGAFISALRDFPADSLHETIAGFHDTRKRFNDLLRAIAEDPACRKRNAQDEIRFALEHEKDIDILGNLAESGALPVRVTHNDTKINNVMLDSDTGRAVCVIDLDTVMPGLAVNDFGDAVRSSALTGREYVDEFSGIGLNPAVYHSLADGFLQGFPDMTQAERQMMPVGAKIMTLECGIRFLADYLEGDRYFKTDYPEHNLNRCRAHFRLVQDMEDKWEEMQIDR